MTARALALLAAVLLLLATPSAPTERQDTSRLADSRDVVAAALLASQAAFPTAGSASHVVVGRSDVFADNLAATALAGSGGALLYTDGGPRAPLRPAVAEEVRRLLGPGAGCTRQDGGPRILVVGGPQAVSEDAARDLAATGHCLERLAGASRIATAAEVARAVAAAGGGTVGTVLLARADDWADAATGGAWAAATSSPLLVTDRDQLHPLAEEVLRDLQPERIVLLGGPAALSDAVADDARAIAPVERVAGAARDATAVAIASQLWGPIAGSTRLLANGYALNGWAYVFAAAPVAAASAAPVLYADDHGPAPATAPALQGMAVRLVGPPAWVPDPGEPVGRLDQARVGAVEAGTFAAPMAWAQRPDREAIYLAERDGRVVRVDGEGAATVLDLSAEVTTAGEGGLLGLAFSPDGTRLVLSYTRNGGDSELDLVDVDGEVQPGTRRPILVVEQPASNHNGGDVHFGPDGFLYFGLGDGGGGGDQFDTAQHPESLLGSMVRIDPLGVPAGGDEPYRIPPGNPFADGQGGAAEVWAYGLRNPFRFSFDALDGDLWIADVGQDSLEEIDHLPHGRGGGSNFGWSYFEGDQPFDGPNEGPPPDDLTFPVHTYPTSTGCAVTGGIVYRGDALPELRGAYLFADFCAGDLMALSLDGDGLEVRDLGVDVGSPVFFGADGDGEVHVLDLGGRLLKIVPA